MSESMNKYDSCYWISKSQNNTDGNLDLFKKIKDLIQNAKVISNPNECESCIKADALKSVLVITSNADGPAILPLIHKLPQLTTVYIYCQNVEIAKSWSKPYPKIKGIFTQPNELLNAIRVGSQQQNESVMPNISVINGNENVHQQKDASFLWFQVFIQVLVRMNNRTRDLSDMIRICRKEVANKTEELEKLDEFEKTYIPEKAIWWFTKHTCIYSVMNRALRNHDYQVLFAFRIFIADIIDALKRKYQQTMLESTTKTKYAVYRGQFIHEDELETLKNSTGKLLSMNSFLSTSLDRDIAIMFSRRDKPDHLQSVVFEIEIDPSVRTKYYADIHEESFFQYENEVLIMIGALFNIKKVTYDADLKLWVIQAILAAEDDYRLINLLKHMQEKIGEQTTLDTLGKLFLKMGENENAKICYIRYFNETQATLADSYLGMGWSAMRLNNLDESLAHFEKSLEIRSNIYGWNHTTVAECYSFIGEVHRLRKNNDEALLVFTKAINIQEISEPESLRIAATYNSVGRLYASLEDAENALKHLKRVLEIRQKLLPTDHPDFAFIYRDLGLVYDQKGESQTAKEYLERAFQLGSQALPPEHSFNLDMKHLHISA